MHKDLSVLVPITIACLLLLAFDTNAQPNNFINIDSQDKALASIRSTAAPQLVTTKPLTKTPKRLEE